MVHAFVLLASMVARRLCGAVVSAVPPPSHGNVEQLRRRPGAGDRDSSADDEAMVSPGCQEDAGGSGAVANEVARWNTHGSADFFETLALYLPSNVLNFLMNIAVNYYQLCDGNSTTTRTCRVRSADGLLSCSRNVNPRYDGYCSHKHWVQAQQQKAAKLAREVRPQLEARPQLEVRPQLRRGKRT